MNDSVLCKHCREGSKRGFPLLEGSGSSFYNIHSRQPCPRSTGEHFASKSLAGGRHFHLQFSWFLKASLNSSKYLPFTEAAENLALQLSLLWPLLCTWVSPHPSTVLASLGCASCEGEGGAGVFQRSQTWCGLSAVLVSSCVGSLQGRTWIWSLSFLTLSRSDRASHAHGLI